MSYSALTTTLLALSIFAPCVNAQESSASFQPYSHNTSAVDAKGVHHQGTDYTGSPPWLSDRLTGVSPDYPYEEKLHHHVGVGVIRLGLDLKTGSVIKTTVIRSTGFKALDDCAVTAFRRWTWKPGKWKEVDMPVKFQLGDISAPLPPRSIRLPPPQVSEPKKTVFAPRPRYPTDAQGHHPVGSGVVLMQVDTKTGRVISATMEKSTGHKILDDAILEAFRKWHFRPGATPEEVRAPITFTHPPNVP